MGGKALLQARHDCGGPREEVGCGLGFKMQVRNSWALGAHACSAGCREVCVSQVLDSWGLYKDLDFILKVILLSV